ncbi:hypothetical protein CSOJ01_00751 [Colletotrichum sojae]|uniref:Uncharacterized protein n=1 Tax=Colletotrichum sojae TaxID=2175907 RepID=A0A8H6JWL4_9PEZI|nr:hypothetical protein CSOJ01_00751 [Colletotrichum sojae]
MVRLGGYVVAGKWRLVHLWPGGHDRLLEADDDDDGQTGRKGPTVIEARFRLRDGRIPCISGGYVGASSSTDSAGARAVKAGGHGMAGPRGTPANATVADGGRHQATGGKTSVEVTRETEEQKTGQVVCQCFRHLPEWHLCDQVTASKLVSAVGGRERRAQSMPCRNRPYLAVYRFGRGLD